MILSSLVTLTPYKMEADTVFIISIERFLQDILRSVKDSPDGYLEKLKRDDAKLQQKFDNAINQIYDPNTKLTENR
jgi:hypothetical protein